MLVLKRREGEWVEVKHEQSGDTIRIRLYDIRAGRSRQATMAFDDSPRKFGVFRPERQNVGTSR